MSLKGSHAVQICDVWNNGGNKCRLIELSKVKVKDAIKSDWNGAILTSMRLLEGIEAVSTEKGTIMHILSTATAPNMLTSSFAIPSSRCCISNFKAARTQLYGNFRATFHGVITDVQQEVEYSKTGNEKRMFDIVDNDGTFLSCCAMSQNAQSVCLKNFQEVILYYCTGRPPIGSSPGMLYLYKDAIIIPVGSPRLLRSPKRDWLEILKEP